MVTMTCCLTSYSNVADSVNHVCNHKESGLTKAIVWFAVWLTGAALLLGVAVGGVVAYDVVVNPSEDSGDLLLNCHVYGDGQCGRNAPWHGFINI